MLIGLLLTMKQQKDFFSKKKIKDRFSAASSSSYNKDKGHLQIHNNASLDILNLQFHAKKIPVNVYAIHRLILLLYALVPNINVIKI